MKIGGANFPEGSGNSGGGKELRIAKGRSREPGGASYAGEIKPRGVDKVRPRPILEPAPCQRNLVFSAKLYWTSRRVKNKLD